MLSFVLWALPNLILIQRFLQILPTNPASMAAMFYLANFGTACYAQTAQSTAVRNFPTADRGKVRPILIPGMSTPSSSHRHKKEPLANLSSMHQLHYREQPRITVFSRL